MSLEEKLKNISISEDKINELKTKPTLLKNIQTVIDTGNEFNTMQYQMACLAPKKCNLQVLSDVINEGVVMNSSLLKALFKMDFKTKEEGVEFCKQHTYDKDVIIKFITDCKNSGETKLGIRKKCKDKFPHYDTSILMDEIKDYGLGMSTEKYQKDWLEEGEIKFLHKAGENKQVNDQILAEHLKRTGGKVVTRFPPEPNGNLHIGHAKALNLSFEFAKKHNGITYMRFDDTNPKNETDELYDSILEDVEWLGFKPYAITASSDHFEKMFEMCRKLLKKGSAYICFCSLEEIRERRQKYQKERDGGNEDATILSPYRNVSIEENLEIFEDMLKGKYKDGECVLRFKLPLESKNPLMLDLVGARIIDMVHERKKRNYIVYPSYEFALCVCDSLEDVTHSFCSREFYTRQEPYHWLLQELEMYEPVQWEFSRLNVSNTVLSKRKLGKVVSMGLKWDDPRFYTVKGLRRRGVPAQAINKFVQSVGITFSESVIDIKIFESFIYKELFNTAIKATCLIEPLKVYINKKTKGNISGQEVEVNKVIYIEKNDFKETETDGFLRLTPKNTVGVINLGVLKYVGKESDGIVCELLNKEDNEPKKYIHWLSNLDNKVELRLYKPLFKSFNPDEVGYLNDIDLEGSLEIKDGFVDLTVLNAKVEDKFQFIRYGFFSCDKDSVISDKNKKLVFNLTLLLNKSH